MSDELISLLVLSIFLIILTLAIAVLIAGAINDNRRNKIRIAKHIKGHGGSDIKISSQFLDFDRANYTYRVAFMDRHGNHRHHECLEHAGHPDVAGRCAGRSGDQH